MSITRYPNSNVCEIDIVYLQRVDDNACIIKKDYEKLTKLDDNLDLTIFEKNGFTLTKHIIEQIANRQVMIINSNDVETTEDIIYGYILITFQSNSF